MRRAIPLIALLMFAGRAHAQPAPRPAPPPVAAPAWDSRGWTLLGEREVNGNVDHDRIEVGGVEGTFNKVTMLVASSDLELLDFKIVFGDKTEYHPKVTHVFKEGARTRVLDLPPSEPVIRFIDFKYRNLPGGGRAKVQVWGWKTGELGPRPPVKPAWDKTGWIMLGEREVNGSYDHDRIDVPRADGKFTKLTIAVDDSDLELIDFAVKFGRGADWHPAVTHYFKEGQRTRVIDLPGDDRVIKRIDIKYRNLPGGGRAKVQVWGKQADAAPKPFAWDQRGWLMLGERTVDGNVDHDKIEVGRGEGKFKKLTIVVLDSDLELIDFSVKFKRGEPFHPEVKSVFRENTRTKVIDLPGDERTIKWIDFTYRNLPGGGRARVQVWAK